MREVRTRQLAPTSPAAERERHLLPNQLDLDLPAGCAAVVEQCARRQGVDEDRARCLGEEAADPADDARESRHRASDAAALHRTDVSLEVIRPAPGGRGSSDHRARLDTDGRHAVAYAALRGVALTADESSTAAGRDALRRRAGRRPDMPSRGPLLVRGGPRGVDVASAAERQLAPSPATPAPDPRVTRARELWSPELQAFVRGELEWQMMRRGLDPTQLAALAGVSERTVYRARAGHRTQRGNAFAILTALTRVPVAIAV